MILLRNRLFNRIALLMGLLLFGGGGGLALVQADSITVNARLVLGTGKEKQGSKKGKGGTLHALCGCIWRQYASAGSA